MLVTLNAQPETAPCLTIQLVANYCKQPILMGNSKNSDTGAILDTPEGTLEGCGTICQYLASLAAAEDAKKCLLGSTDEEKAQVSDWIYRSGTTLNIPSQPVCAEINETLKNRTFLVGSSLTLADLVVFGILHSTVTKLAPAELVFLCNLTRWMDYIHSISGASSLFKALYFKRPQFNPPAELLSPAAPAAAKGGDAKGGDAKKGDAKKGDAKGGDAKGGDAKGADTKKEDAKKGDGKADAKAAAKGNSKDGGAKKAAGEAKADPKKDAKPKEGTEAEGGGDKKSKKEKKEKKEKKPEQPKQEDILTPTILDVRVGTIIEVEKHPNAESLYLEKIDVGEAAPRQVVSGLVKFIPESRMLGARVLVLCNVKPCKMRDIESFGMVMCASNEDHTKVDFVTPPEGVSNGERVLFEGYEGEPEAVLNPKKKQFEKLAPELKTNGDGIACYHGSPFKTTKGLCTSPLLNAFIK